LERATKAPSDLFHCNTFVYDYYGPDEKVSFKATYFVPASPEYLQPQKGDDIKCPECGSKPVAFSNQLNSLHLLSDWPFEGTGMDDWKR
jgi:hypothetical protein